MHQRDCIWVECLWNVIACTCIVTSVWRVLRSCLPNRIFHPLAIIISKTLANWTDYIMLHGDSNYTSAALKHTNQDARRLQPKHALHCLFGRPGSD